MVDYNATWMSEQAHERLHSSRTEDEKAQVERYLAQIHVTYADKPAKLYFLEVGWFAILINKTIVIFSIIINQ